MNSRKLKLYSGLSALLLLVGCAGTTEIVEISPNVYSLSGYSDITDNAGSVRINLIKKAQAFCAAKGQRLHTLESTQADGNSNKSATATINFYCEPAPDFDTTSSDVPLSKL